MWQVGKSVWLARNQTHKTIETTPLNSAVFPMNSSKRREKKKNTAASLLFRMGGPPISAHKRNGLKPENNTRGNY
jgi:hypothetical protein